MKKIVGIIAALALAGSVFAEPSVSPVIAEFKGDASLEWSADLDSEKIGMQNKQSANFKVTFIAEGTKATTGEGLWGELEIKEGKTEVNAEKDKPVKFAAGDTWVAAPTVEKAIIHFVDDDFYASMDIKGPDLGLGGGDLFLATQSKKAYPATSATLTGAQGFKINFGLKDLFDANVSFADDGLDKMSNKDFGFKADGSLKAVENLLLYAGVAYTSEEEKLAFATKASYKVDLDDFYLRPSVGFTLKDKAKYLAGALMFGWDAEGEGADANFAGFKTLPALPTVDELKATGMTEADAKKYLAWVTPYASSGSVPNKCNSGVSVMISSTLEDKEGIDILVGAYDSKFIAEFLPGFSAGAQFFANTETMDDAWVLDAAIKYGNTFDIWKIEANFGLKTVKFGDETNAGFLYGFGVSTDNSLIQNTKLYANYAGETAKDLGGKNLKGTITVGTQIHF
ncbi:MAG: hypothetical protein IKR64_05915 [Treponema sp.]|nr:hypothetical protein [Treponema sp.]